MGDVISVPLLASYAAQSQPDLIIVRRERRHAARVRRRDRPGAVGVLPPDARPSLHQLVPGEASQHPFFADGSPHRAHADDGRRIVVFGLPRRTRTTRSTSRRAPRRSCCGASTTRRRASASSAPSSSAELAAAVGGNTQEVAVFGGGRSRVRDATQTTATAAPVRWDRVFMVDLRLTGAKLPFSIPGGMTYPVAGDALFDVNGDNVFDRGYVGDLGGNACGG